MSGRLKGKRALVTGGGSGIGAAIVERFSQEGAQVLSADLAGADVVVDVRVAESVEAAVEHAAARLGGIDTVVCNAGRPVLGAAHEIDYAEWNDGLATNLTSVYLMAKASWPYLQASRGSILATASMVGIVGSAGQAAYCTSKAGVVMLTKCLALDGAADGIRANCVCPGFTETPMLERFLAGQENPEATISTLVSSTPLGRLGRPTDIADAFVYLASDEAGWVTGTSLVVDGGATTGILGG